MALFVLHSPPFSNDPLLVIMQLTCLLFFFPLATLDVCGVAQLLRRASRHSNASLAITVLSAVFTNVPNVGRQRYERACTCDKCGPLLWKKVYKPQLSQNKKQNKTKKKKTSPQNASFPIPHYLHAAQNSTHDRSDQSAHSVWSSPMITVVFRGCGKMKSRFDQYIQRLLNCNIAAIGDLNRTRRWLWLIAKCFCALFAMTVVLPI